MRSLPRGLVRRIGGVGRVALSAGRAATGRLTGDPDADQRFGEHMASELDQLKGLAMKIGQILSYMDVLPEASAAALSRLQEGHEPLDPDAVDAVVRQAFGAGVHELFEGFDPVPVASASIGQVHRARFEGREVAVKVQYPGIAEVLAADARHLRRLGRLASLGASVDGVAFVEELRLRIAEECDYLREARSQCEFHSAWEHDPEVRVPEVVDARTAGTVLTTTWADGESFAELCPSDAERRSWAGVVLVRFAYGSLFGQGVIQADPHPGNTRFAERQVVFLDYGCVRRYESAEIEHFRRYTRAIVDGDQAGFREAALSAGIIARPDRFDLDRHWRWMREFHRPFWQEGFRFDRPWMAEVMKDAGPTNPNGRWLSWPPGWLWILRLQWGLAGVLCALRAEGDFRTTFRDVLD